MAEIKQTFGGAGGALQGVNMSGSQVTFYWGDALVNITVGSTSYGGNTKGLQSLTVTMPNDGVVILKKMQARTNQGYMVVSYLEFDLSGSIKKVGNFNANTATLEAMDGCQITFTGISSGGLIDRLQYRILPS
ncbi:hypothetical protein [Chromobacterium subtsugae]|uniref:hypothetical protein n=1 Tax=Chromobacterium subtsugae TaxID=251747 RepID=UPI000640D980|nr:hypothetical protein [Chromobacterium subtsugae]